MSILDQISPDLGEQLYVILRDSREALSEYELIRLLLERSETGEERGNLFRDPLLLFKTHFLVFHALYQLQTRLVSEQSHYLSIDPLKIQLLPLEQDGQQELSRHDPLRDYYLDSDNLENTTETEVIELLGDFWKKILFSGRRKEALDILELQDPVNQEEITLQYRRLVMKHHPDRGGDDERIKQLNLAMEILTCK